MGFLKSDEADKLIEEMLKKGKGKYITQGVSFNKESPRQLELLKMVLMSSSSFSGFVKEMLVKELNAMELLNKRNSLQDAEEKHDEEEMTFNFKRLKKS